MKRDAQSIRISNSLPQSPAATAPSSEGAKGLGCACGQARQREPRGGRRSLVPPSPVLRPKRRGFTGGTWFLPSDRARPPPASAGVRFSAIHLPEIYEIPGGPRKSGAFVGAVPPGVSAETPAIKRGVPGGISISPQNRFCGAYAPAFTARTWPPGAPPNNPGCASGWCCRPPE